jgi:hypothetical protein
VSRILGLFEDLPMCYRGNVTKITQMVPEYSPQRGNPWKGFGPRGFLYSFLMVYCNTHSHSSSKNVTPTHTKFVHKVTFFTREVTFLKVLLLPGLKDYRQCERNILSSGDIQGIRALTRHMREGVSCKFGVLCLDMAVFIMVWYAIQKR